MEMHSLLALAEFDAKRPVTKMLHSSDPLRLVLFCLEAGQTVPAHSSPSTVAFYTLSGEGQVLVGDKKVAAEAGSLVMIQPNEPHGLSAGRGRLVVLAAIAPAPQ